jgi:hypothetical protein
MLRMFGSPWACACACAQTERDRVPPETSESFDLKLTFASLAKPRKARRRTRKGKRDTHKRSRHPRFDRIWYERLVPSLFEGIYTLTA